MTRCAGLTRSGDQCSASAAAGGRYCYLHDPQFADRRKMHATKAAKARGHSELGELKAALKKLFDGVNEGTADPRRAAVAAQVANVLLRALSVERDLREQEELVYRIEKLEASL
jgi:hypothetical protein